MRFPKYLLCVALSLSVGSVASAQGRGHGGGNGHSQRVRDNDRENDHDRDADRDRDHDRDADRDRDHDRDRDRDREDHRHSFSQASSRPPGWDKGKKVGWGDCNVPPGQAKKSGCGSATSHHDRDHDRDRDHAVAAHHHDTHSVTTASNHRDADRHYVQSTKSQVTSTTAHATTSKQGSKAASLIKNGRDESRMSRR